MAITFVQQKKRQQILIFVVLGMGVITMFILWFGFFASTPNEASSSFFLPPPRETQIDFQALESPIFEELGAPLSPTETPAQTQKANPFLRTQTTR